MKKFNNQQNTAGFTLIETLVYIFIFGLLTVGAVSLLFSLQDLFAEHRAKHELFVSGTAALDRILLEIREAESVDQAGSVFASTTASVLSLNKDGEVVTFSRQATDLELLVDGVDQGSFLTENVSLLSSTFYRYVENDIELIRVNLVLRAIVGTVSEDYTISGAAILRGTYDQT